MSFSTAQLGPPLERRAWETLLERFEDAWHAGAPPSLEAFLAPLGSDPARAELLAELIQIDLDYRWRRIVKTPEAAPFILEDYLARFPELSVRDFAPLLAWEYRARHRWGDRPAHDDYARRFPQHAAQLADLLSRIDTELAREFSASRRLSSRTRPAPASTVKSAPVALSRDELIETLRQTAILTADQLDAVTAALPARNLAPEALVAELRNRGWLTVFQTQELLEGRGPDLVLGPYVLLERLGAGGVGQVFKARDRDRERLVALKVIRPELLQDAEVLRRFYREIQIVGRLHHPNLVEGYDSGPIGETHCLVMEYLEGVDLAQLVRERGPLPVAGACDYVRQAALGLQHAHERQLVHRDVKPANLLVSGDGESETSPQQVKVLDLGLARLRPTGDGEITGMLTAGQATSMLTPAGAFMIGTPDYLAPEQALDFHAADIRADIYSLGCTCYFLLTGQPPFPGGTLAQKLLWHQQAEVPAIEALRPDVPAALAEVLRRMLAKRPEDRWQTPGEVATALSDPAYQKLRQPPPASLPAVPAPVLHQTTVALSPARPSRRKSAALWPRALVLAVGCALVLFFVRPGPQEAPLPQPVVTPPTE
ncbi:MAG: protein kinase, partial [Planctomycetia bacterium]|nr:protein kinase [Planctomycetia bacterium]